MNKHGLNVLSLFDGIGCGWIALKELGIPINKAYASEIDKGAIGCTKHNFPNVIHLGDIRNVDVSKLERIDLLIGGSPCNDFSICGKKRGAVTTSNVEITSLDQYLQIKKNGVEMQGSSYLFWEYMRILTEIKSYNPNVLFFLENVKMKKAWKNIIDKATGVRGIKIDAALLSAQHRERIYWTNFKTRQNETGKLECDIPQPKECSLLLRDVLDKEVDEKLYVTNTHKFKTLLSQPYQELEPKRIIRQINPDRTWGKRSPSIACHVFDINSVCGSVIRSCGAILKIRVGDRIRRLSTSEYARLQTIPDWYEFKYQKPNGEYKQVSNTHKYHLIGNAWCVNVIKYLFGFIDLNKINEK